MKQDIIQIRELTREYPPVADRPSILALDRISLSIPKGEFTCILGESGCGKTTLLRMIAGLDPCREGEILIDGEAPRGPNPKCGMVFQNNVLFPWLTVYENVAFAPRRMGTLKGREEELRQLLQSMKLDAFADCYPGQLSGGMQQRAALARALAARPDILLLDEPLSSLDAFTRMHLQDELLRIWEETGCTVIMVTHDIDEAVYLAGRIVVMSPHPGRISECVLNELTAPRDRTSAGFVALRNHLLKELYFANRNRAEGV